ncbi:DUF3598 family protein [Trichocoleus sp. Lan]|uniref:DUF3598 family protein n=1 Tax=Trichocoleus sp. Lan TaxID=2933927 RepID=UPI0032997D38
MASQWERLLQNLGEWQGSFTRLSSTGELQEDTPTVVSLEGLDNNHTIRQIIRRLPPGQPPDEKVLEYSSLGKSVLFFENGAFSQGSIQLAPFSEFGAELGLIDGNRRLRLVQIFNRDGQLDKITLIREKLADSDVPERPHLTLDQLIGEWQGEAVTIYPDYRSPDTYSTTLKVDYEESGNVIQQLSFGDRIFTSTARMNGNILRFEQGSLPVQVLFLPDGASSNCPLQVKTGQSFVLEVGWLLKPDLRQRMIRRYSDKGEWISLTLVTERKV